VTSDYRPEVEIRPIGACAMKICNISLICGRIAEIFVSYRKSGSRNTMLTSDLKAKVEITAVSCMRSTSGHNYRNSSFIVDLAVRQIPRSTERISSLHNTPYYLPQHYK